MAEHSPEEVVIAFLYLLPKKYVIYLSNLTWKHTRLPSAGHTVCTHSNGENKHFLNIISVMFSTTQVNYFLNMAYNTMFVGH